MSERAEAAAAPVNGRAHDVPGTARQSPSMKSFGAWLQRLDAHPLTERVLMALVILNAIVLGLETSKPVMAAIGPLLDALDQTILAIFVVEIASRLIVHRWGFFRDRWNVFDFVVVGMALIPATNSFSVLRALRILRVLRLITAVPTLKRVSAGLLASLPGMGSILFLIGLLYYVFGVLATTLFGEAHPTLFGSLPAALWTLFT